VRSGHRCGGERKSSGRLPRAARATLKRLGLRSDGDFVGRRISVNGVAERVRIDFTGNGRSTGKYDYQTHVRVGRPGQISLAE